MVQTPERGIIVVENDPGVVRLVGALLDDEKYRNTLFTDPQEALDFYITEPENHGLVIAGFNMRGMNGFECIGKFREVKPIPAMILSGEPFTGEQLEYMRQQQILLERKPIDDIDKFIGIVNNIMRPPKPQTGRRRKV